MNSLFKVFFGVFLILGCLSSRAQEGQITISVVDAKTQKALPDVIVSLVEIQRQEFTDENGIASFTLVAFDEYTCRFQKLGYDIYSTPILMNQEEIFISVEISNSVQEIDQVTIVNRSDFELKRLRSIEGTSIYAAKKNEVIDLRNIDANLANNNSRQLYAKVPGLNIWESDASGLQLGIGARGLSPQRTSNFNTKQNGYDISADALGYPESYYTPPAEALERIELVRGAASLQYGTQFGGMLNFVMKKGPQDKKLDLKLRQSIGSYQFSNTFVSAGGTVNKLNYYTFFQRKTGDGWRPNGAFESNTFYTGLKYQATQKASIDIEYTYMDYNAQQSGGLTDAMFEDDPTQSIRERNWFHVNWNVFALNFNYEFSPKAKLDIRNFGLIGQRDALGFLGQINRADPGEERDYILGQFNNYGSEVRFIQRYDSLTKESSFFLIGARYYQGRTISRQGLASANNNPDYSFISQEGISSDHEYPSTNVALFTENVFNLNPRWSITPGARFEYIKSGSDGFFIQTVRDLAGNIIFQEEIEDQLNNERSFLLLGIGVGFRVSEYVESYANFSQNYRAINFNDLRIINPNFRIDENLEDESGFNADLGIRGNIGKKINFDASVFCLKYNNRIGLILDSDPETFTTFQFRTNIADSRTLGLETYIEGNVLEILGKDSLKTRLNVFGNIALVDSRYISDSKTIDQNFVELSPRITFRSGVRFVRENFSISYQFSYTSEHYTDATNAVFTPSAVNGLIPAYQVMDLSANYVLGAFKLEAGINNLTNQYYFTRRAASYPGPGIIPAQDRTFYLGIQWGIQSRG